MKKIFNTVLLMCMITFVSIGQEHSKSESGLKLRSIQSGFGGYYLKFKKDRLSNNNDSFGPTFINLISMSIKKNIFFFRIGDRTRGL
ncbi:hypothetical protein [Aquimarina sp. RZ0]|uniref:hypothetical protein n=1 Tax=Aquimarina sp. RZ0 TaxID=2607730 RepID=UPI0011F25FF5|nr:hypothetical protein [Aquimarina sp. RZ0]KAA1243122.1 hypothetical protein F0000_22440 [Aquimarina sp. RZ0]